jgi:hypothetical protein
MTVLTRHDLMKRYDITGVFSASASSPQYIPSEDNNKEKDEVFTKEEVVNSSSVCDDAPVIRKKLNKNLIEKDSNKENKLLADVTLTVSNSVIREENRFKEKNQEKDGKNKKKKMEHPSFYKHQDDYILNYKHKSSNYRMGECISSLLIMNTLVSEGHVTTVSYFEKGPGAGRFQVHHLVLFGFVLFGFVLFCFVWFCFVL